MPAAGTSSKILRPAFYFTSLIFRPVDFQLHGFFAHLSSPNVSMRSFHPLLYVAIFNCTIDLSFPRMSMLSECGSYAQVNVLRSSHACYFYFLHLTSVQRLSILFLFQLIFCIISNIRPQILFYLSACKLFDKSYHPS